MWCNPRQCAVSQLCFLISCGPPFCAMEPFWSPMGPLLEGLAQKDSRENTHDIFSVSLMLKTPVLPSKMPSISFLVLSEVSSKTYCYIFHYKLRKLSLESLYFSKTIFLLNLCTLRDLGCITWLRTELIPGKYFLSQVMPWLNMHFIYFFKIYYLQEQLTIFWQYVFLHSLMCICNGVFTYSGDVAESKLLFSLE